MSRGMDQKNELFWALIELKERLWLAWAAWGKGDSAARNTTLRLVDQGLDLVQYRESFNPAELRTLLDKLAAMAPDKRLDNDIDTLKQVILRYEQDTDENSRD